jgi:maleylpyruvate isomerase
VTEVSSRHDVARTRAWVDEGTAVLEQAIDEITDSGLDAPTRLTGWHRRHVVAHLARNAEALSRLLAWARTGIVTPMYVDAEQRATEIDRSAQQDAAQLRDELFETSIDLRNDVDSLTEEQWSNVVRSARGREIPAAEVPWMRAREVWLHAIDLDAGVGLADLPANFSLTLVEDVVGFLAAMPSCPAFRVACGDRTWSVGDDGPLVQGEPQHVAAWLTGRSGGEGLWGDAPPKLPAWL